MSGNPHCICTSAGYCSRHEIHKTEDEYEMCSGQAVHQPDCGFRFWCAWEKGRLGAKKQSPPLTERSDWDCKHNPPVSKHTHTRARDRKQRQERRRNVSKVGDVLSEMFESVGFRPIKGCACTAAKNQLNSVTAEEILSDVEHWAAVVQKSAREWKEMKGGLWQLIPTPPISIFSKLVKDAATKAAKEE